MDSQMERSLESSSLALLLLESPLAYSFTAGRKFRKYCYFSISHYMHALSDPEWTKWVRRKWTGAIVERVDWFWCGGKPTLILVLLLVLTEDYDNVVAFSVFREGLNSR